MVPIFHFIRSLVKYFKQGYSYDTAIYKIDTFKNNKISQVMRIWRVLIVHFVRNLLNSVAKPKGM